MKKTTIITIAFLAISFFTLNAADTATATSNVSVSSSGKKVFDFTLTKGWSNKLSEKKLILIPPAKYPHIQLWNIEKVKNIADAEKTIANVLKSEVLKFKVKESKKIKIAGADAKKLVGNGLEADDQDPSNAVVYLFTVNSKTFILCIHGEGDEAAKYADSILTMLNTIKPVKQK